MPGDCQHYYGVPGHSDKGFDRDPDCLCLGWSRDCQHYYGYSDMGFYRCLWSRDCQSYYGVPGYSDMGFYRDPDWDGPRTVSYYGVSGYSDMGAMPGMDCQSCHVLCHAKNSFELLWLNINIPVQFMASLDMFVSTPLRFLLGRTLYSDLRLVYPN